GAAGASRSCLRTAGAGAGAGDRAAAGTTPLFFLMDAGDIGACPGGPECPAAATTAAAVTAAGAAASPVCESSQVRYARICGFASADGEAGCPLAKYICNAWAARSGVG